MQSFPKINGTLTEVLKHVATTIIVCSAPYMMILYDPTLFAAAEHAKAIYGSYLLLLLWPIAIYMIATERTDFGLLDLLLVLYFVFRILHMCFIKTPNEDLFGFFEIWTSACFFLTYRLIAPKYIDVIRISIATSAGLLALILLSQIFGVIPSSVLKHPFSGTFANPAHCACFLLVSFPFLAQYLSTTDAKRRSELSRGRYYLTSLAILMGVSVICLVVISALLILESRATWLAMITMTLVVLWQHRVYLLQVLEKNPKIPKLKRSHWTLLIFSTFLILLCFALIGLYWLRPDSATARIIIWKNTFDLIGDNFLLGVGIGGYESHYLHYQASSFVAFPDSPASLLVGNNIYAFNEFLRIFSEEGIVGFLFAVTISGIALYKVSNLAMKRWSVGYSILTSVVAIIVFSMFSYPDAVFGLKVLFYMVLATLSSLDAQTNVILRIQSLSSTCIILLIVLAISISILQVGQAGELAKLSKKWKSAFASAAHISLNEGEVAGEIAGALSGSGLFNALHGRLLMELGNYRDAMNALQIAAIQRPTSNVYLDLGKCYEHFGFKHLALNTYNYSLLLVPHRVLPVVEMVRITSMEDPDLAIMLGEKYMKRKYKKNTLGTIQATLELERLMNQILTK